MSENCFPEIGRCVSIFDRLMKMYYDHGLSEYEIGWGQQFYVEYIYEYPGATPQEMTDRFRVDRATLTKTIRKLTEVEYIRVEGDEKDRRVKHLYLTENGRAYASSVYEKHCIIRDYLIDRGVSPAAAESDACKMEHLVSEETFLMMINAVAARRG